MIKKIFSIPILISLLLVLFSINSYAAEKIGEIHGTMYIAQINCEQIPLYIYNGYPYIVAEDLGGYGFDINWDAYTDVLDIKYNPDKKFYPYNDGDCHFDTNNTKISDVYTSNTVVRLQGEVIPAYSLNGRMIVSLDDFWRVGSVTWYDDATTISLLTNEYMEKNPDWKILVHAWCLYYSLKVADTVLENTCTFDNVIMVYAYTGKKSSDEKFYECFDNMYYYVDQKLKAIENNNFLYYKGPFYQFAYAVRSDVINFRKWYDGLFSGDTIEWSWSTQEINSDSLLYNDIRKFLSPMPKFDY